MQKFFIENRSLMNIQLDHVKDSPENIWNSFSSAPETRESACVMTAPIGRLNPDIEDAILDL